MRILLVDNGTKHLEQLVRVLGRHELVVVATESLEGVETGKYQGAILSGSYEHPVEGGDGYYDAEVELIKGGKLPILGICLGFELICHAFGAKLSELAEKIEGANRIVPTAEGAKLFQGSDPIRVAESHRWCVEDLPKTLVKLAVSDTGIEAVRHKTQPIFGLQFHPEDFTYSSDGKLVFENIVHSFGR